MQVIAGALALVAAATLASCGSTPLGRLELDGGVPSDGGAPITDGGLSSVDGGAIIDGGAPIRDGGATSPLITDRPYRMKVPTAYDGMTATPLVVLLHGYSADSAVQDAYFGLSALAERRGFLLALPDGTRDPMLLRRWNASDACCGPDTVDDVGYLRALIDDVEARFNVDAKRIHLIGHSNGGFMAHRLACDLAPRIAGIVSLAGAAWSDASRCRPSAPVAILQLHGDRDPTVLYEGGAFFGRAYPAARETVATWAAKNGCTSVALLSSGTTHDLVTTVAGSETVVSRYDGCRSNGAVELWTMIGAGHIPPFQADATERLYDFLVAHPKR